MTKKLQKNVKTKREKKNDLSKQIRTFTYPHPHKKYLHHSSLKRNSDGM